MVTLTKTTQQVITFQIVKSSTVIGVVEIKDVTQQVVCTGAINCDAPWKTKI